MQASPDGTQREIKGATNYTYTCQTEDLDGSLCVSFEPIRSDGARGPVVVSEMFGPVLPGKYHVAGPASAAASFFILVFLMESLDF